MDKILKSAVKRELVQLVPSQWMEKYLKGRKEFTDWEKATLIWNAPNTTLSNRVASLEVLAKHTLDEILKEQIRDRIIYEKEAYMLFVAIDKGYVYVLRDEKGDDLGFFENEATAKQFGIRYAKEMKEKHFRVEKHRIISSANDPNNFIKHNLVTQEILVEFTIPTTIRTGQLLAPSSKNNKVVFLDS